MQYFSLFVASLAFVASIHGANAAAVQQTDVALPQADVTLPQTDGRTQSSGLNCLNCPLAVSCSSCPTGFVCVVKPGNCYVCPTAVCVRPHNNGDEDPFDKDHHLGDFDPFHRDHHFGGEDPFNRDHHFGGFDPFHRDHHFGGFDPFGNHFPHDPFYAGALLPWWLHQRPYGDWSWDHDHNDLDHFGGGLDPFDNDEEHYKNKQVNGVQSPTV